MDDSAIVPHTTIARRTRLRKMTSPCGRKLRQYLPGASRIALANLEGPVLWTSRHDGATVETLEPTLTVVRDVEWCRGFEWSCALPYQTDGYCWLCACAGGRGLVE